MDELYELKKDKRRYKALKNNLIQINNILSNIELHSSSKALENYYNINNNSIKSGKLNNIDDCIENNRSELKSIISNLEYKLNNIQKEINALE